MKTAVVYYSLDGSTRMAAQVLAERFEADVFELKETKQRKKGFALFVLGGFAASTGRKSRVQDTFVDRMGGYDFICIGTPIWASSPVPAVNTFADTLDPADKQVMLFTVQADPNTSSPPGKRAEQLCAVLREKGGSVLPILRMNGNSPGQTATKEHIEKQLEQKLEAVLQKR